ncbi:MAG TPA: WD40 repeat domain-containing protein, partial [Gemmata sp.]
MSRVACVLLLLASSVSVRGADLPPGAVARLGDPSFRAGSRIYHLALSPDGKQYATVRRGADGNVLVAVCDSATGRVLREYEQNGDLFGGLVWAPGGAHAVTIRAELGQKDKPARVFPDDFRVWNFADLKSDPPPALPVAISFHLPGRVDAVEPAHSARYTDFRFGSAGTRVAVRWKSANGQKHAIHVFELKPTSTASKLTQCGTIDLGAEGVDEFLVSADGKTVVTFRKLVAARDERADQYTATTWDLSGKPSKPVRVEAYSAASRRETPRLMLTPDARALALFAEDADSWGFDLLDLATCQRRKLTRWKRPPPDTSVTDTSECGGFAFSADGRLLAVATDGKTFVIDTEAGKELGRLEGHADTPTAVAVSADGAVIATADWFGLVRLWNTKGLTSRGDAPGHRAPVQHAELSPDGKRLLTWANDETVRLWDLATGQELRAFTGALGPRAGYDRPTFTPDGTAIFYSTGERLVSRDLLSGLEVPLPGGMKGLKPRFVAFAPDGRAALTWSVPGELVEVWDWPSGKKRFALDATHTDAAGFSADSKAVHPDSSSDGWDAATGKKLAPAPWPDERLYQLRALRPNPPLILDSDENRPVRVLQYGTAQRVPTPPLDNVRAGSHFFLTGGVAFSPDYRQFCSPPLEGSEAVLCETATGQARRSLGGHRGEVRVLGFTPDGSKLLTAGGEHSVLVWDMRLQSVPLPDELKKETNALKLWDALAGTDARAAYLAMARLSREPGAAVKMAKLRLKPAAKGGTESEADTVADARAVELLEALATDDARALLKELAAGNAAAFRTQEAQRALGRLARI